MGADRPVARMVERALPHLVAVGDIVEHDGHLERVVDVRARLFFVTVPAGRRKPSSGTFTVRYSDLEGGPGQ